jgi:hypothetical protein
LKDLHANAPAVRAVVVPRARVDLAVDALLGVEAAGGHVRLDGTEAEVGAQRRADVGAAFRLVRLKVDVVAVGRQREEHRARVDQHVDLGREGEREVRFGIRRLVEHVVVTADLAEGDHGRQADRPETDQRVLERIRRRILRLRRRGTRGQQRREQEARTSERSHE